MTRLDIFAICSRKAVESANEHAEAARYDQALQDLTGQLRKSQASLEGARRVAENTPVELEAVARIAQSVDVKTRTMPVELDVANPKGRLASGMFPEVVWPVRPSEATLFVPASSVARTTEATFVVRIHDWDGGVGERPNRRSRWKANRGFRRPAPGR